jgi:hypothetical protein
MLSRILHQHPNVLSVNEFFATLMRALHDRVFPVGELDGQELWWMLSMPFHFFDAALRDGLKFPELCYPYGQGRFDPRTARNRPGTRSEPGDGVPMICHATLPMLTDDPDALFDKLATEVTAWPRRPAGEQYRALFRLLAGTSGRTAVVERSSTSLSVVALLHQQFPEARFVYMHREGADCAQSISRHPMYRMAGLRAAAVRATGSSSSWDEIDAEFARLYQLNKIPEEFTGLVGWPFDAERFMTYPIPLDFFGRLWSRMVRQGAASLSELPSDAWISVRYHELLADPGAQLARLADHMGVQPVPQWLAAAGELIAQRRAGAAAAGPSPDELASLREACADGEQAISGAESRRTGSVAARS